jgi:hypothetical protein
LRQNTKKTAKNAQKNGYFLRLAPDFWGLALVFEVLALNFEGLALDFRILKDTR